MKEGEYTKIYLVYKDTMIVLNSKVSWQKFDEMIYIVNEENKDEFILEGVSKIIWEALTSKKTIEESQANYIEEIDNLGLEITKDILIEDFHQFVQSLLDNKIVMEEI